VSHQSLATNKTVRLESSSGVWRPAGIGARLRTLFWPNRRPGGPLGPPPPRNPPSLATTGSGRREGQPMHYAAAFVGTSRSANGMDAGASIRIFYFDRFDSLGPATISHNQRMDSSHRRAASRRGSAGNAADVRARWTRPKNPPNWFDRFDSLGFVMISHNQRTDLPRQVPASEPTGRAAGGGPGKGRAANRFATPWMTAPAPTAQNPLQIGLIGLIHSMHNAEALLGSSRMQSAAAHSLPRSADCMEAGASTAHCMERTTRQRSLECRGALNAWRQEPQPGASNSQWISHN
jgi:hypothetical protein